MSIYIIYDFAENTKNPCVLHLWHMTLKLFGFRAVVKEHVYAKFHRAKCSGSRVINSVLDSDNSIDFDREHIWNGSRNR